MMSNRAVTRLGSGANRSGGSTGLRDANQFGLVLHAPPPCQMDRTIRMTHLLFLQLSATEEELNCLDECLVVRRTGWWCAVYEVDPDGTEQPLSGDSGKNLAERFGRLVSAPTPPSSPVPAPYILHATTGFPETKSRIHGGRESAESENVVVIVDREIRRLNGLRVLTLTPAHQSQWLSQLCSIAADSEGERGWRTRAELP